MQGQPSLDQIRSSLRQVLPELRRRYPIASVGIFGSWVRGEAGPASDLDLLVTFDGPIGWEIVTLQDEFSRRLGVAVDIVLDESLKPHIGRHMRREVERVWSARGEPVT